MKALVIGFGSIGQRHATILESMGLSVAVVTRRAVNYAQVFPNISVAVDKFQPDYVVIASRTAEHLNDINELAACGFEGIVLVEKPLFAHVERVPENRFKNFFIGYNRRFHPVILQVKSMLKGKEVFTANVYQAQYLPDWRKPVDYRSSYSAHKSLGGGVLRELSHDIDLAQWLFGAWSNITSCGGHTSNLEIDADDAFTILMQTERCPLVTLHLNCLDRELTYTLRANTSEGTITADLITGKISYCGQHYDLSIDRDITFRAQHEAAIAGHTDGLCSVAEGIYIMKTIAAVETAAQGHTWVSQ